MLFKKHIKKGDTQSPLNRFKFYQSELGSSWGSGEWNHITNVG